MDREFLALLDRYAPAIRDALIEGIRNIRDNALLAQVTQMVERNDVNGALRALGYNPVVFNGLYAQLTQAFQAGGMLLIGRQPTYATGADGTKVKMYFNVRDRDAERWLQQQSASLVTNIESDIRLAVRDTLQAGLAEGRNPRNVALDLVGRYDSTTGHREGGVIGLSEQGQQWSRSARQKLLTLDESYFELELRDKRFDATVRAAIDAGRPLPAAVVDKLTDRYRAAALRHRGEMIGRTEALAALNRSEFEATRQALLQSDLPMDAAKKVWDSAGDARVRNSHRALDGQKVGLDEAFESPVTGAKMMHPGDTTLGAGGRDVISCYAPWTKISVTDLRNVVRRDYVGQLINISIGIGDDVSVTPNHPILTKRGWLGAGDIVEGDQLIYRFFGDRMSLVETNKSDVHPTAEQLHSFYNVACGSERVSNKVVNLHGEIPDHDVDVILVPRELRDGVETFGSQHLDHFTLTETDISQGRLLFDRITATERGVGEPTTRGNVRRFGSLFSRFRRHLLRGASVTLAGVRAHKTYISDATVHNGSADTDFFCDGIDRLTFTKQPSNSVIVSRTIALMSRFCQALNRVRGEAHVRDARKHDAPSDTQVNHDVFDRSTFGVHLSHSVVKFFSLVFETLGRTFTFGSKHTIASDGLVREVVSDTDMNGTLPDGQTTLVSGNDSSTERFGVFSVAKVSRSHYEGPVYNFETGNGLVLAEGIVSHNCRCKVRYEIDYLYEYR